jgi:hypothetical protein
MHTWEENVKFMFGNITDMEEIYEVNVPGIPDNVAIDVEDSFHSMRR